MAASSIKLAQVLFMSAAFTAVMAVVFYLDVFGLGDTARMLMWLCLANTVFDLAVAAVMLSRSGR